MLDVAVLVCNGGIIEMLVPDRHRHQALAAEPGLSAQSALAQRF